MNADFLLLVLILGLIGLVTVAFAAPLIPVRQRPLSAFPVVTFGLIALNVWVFLVTSQGGRLVPEVAQTWGLIPRAGALVPLLTSIFLHADWMHLGVNMLGLGLFGARVEEALGRQAFLLFFIGCGAAAGLLHAIVAATLLPAAATVPLVGASGAIFGILGLWVVRFYRARVRVFLVAEVPAIWALGAFALLQVVMGMASVAAGGRGDNTANWAHVGGFLFGMLLAVPLQMREEGKRQYHVEDAETALAAGRLDQAAAYYRLVLGETPDDAGSHQALARACVGLGQSEAAHRHFTDALRFFLRAGNAPRVADVYEEIGRSFTTFPLSSSLLYRTGSACEEVERYPLALRAFSTLCHDLPSAPEAEIALLRMGQLHLKRLQQPDCAAGIFAEFLRLYPASEWRGHVQRLLQEARESARGRGPLPAAPG